MTNQITNQTRVYVALGGNVGETALIFLQALKMLRDHPNVRDLEVSSFHRTVAVSDIPQNDFLNAVCRFQTSMSAPELLRELQAIETALGKEPKAKHAPRALDLDILFFGQERHSSSDLEIPHPQWQERPFVLIPLAELVTELSVPDVEHPGRNALVNIPKLSKKVVRAEAAKKKA